MIILDAHTKIHSMDLFQIDQSHNFIGRNAMFFNVEAISWPVINIIIERTDFVAHLAKNKEIDFLNS